jgi:hypothetical protein
MFPPLLRLLAPPVPAQLLLLWPTLIPLDDDPLASLSVADLAAMEAVDNTEGGSSSKYEEEDYNE